MLVCSRRIYTVQSITLRWQPEMAIEILLVIWQRYSLNYVINNGNIAMVGYNSIPKILYCARKGAAVGHGPIAMQMNSELLKELEEQGQKS